MLGVKTIESYDQGRDNNYNLLRFVASSMVIYFHSYILSGSGKDPLFELVGYTDIGQCAVNVFFAVSGFLVTKSLVSRRNLTAYFEARILRIFPALIVAVMFTVFIVGLWATSKSFTAFLQSKMTFLYILHNVTLIKGVAHHLPGVFETNPFKGSVNGSLWTLYMEIWMYIILTILGVLGILNRQKLFNIVLLLFILLYFLFPYNFPLLSEYTHNPRLAAFFAFGAFCYINRNIILMHSLLLVSLAVVAIILHSTSYGRLSFNIALAYSVFWFAYRPSGWIRKFNLFGDYSYGLYIYAFPIQQSIAFSLNKMSPASMFILSYPLTLILAVMSWYLVEKPALGLKGKVPWSSLESKFIVWR